MRKQGQRPKTVFVGIFHVRDVDRVKKMLADFRSRLEGERPVKKTRPVPESVHAAGLTAEGSHMSVGPMHLTCDHFLFVAPSRRTADALRGRIEETLEGAVEHVVTRTFTVPKEVENTRKKTARGHPPSGVDRHRPRRRSSM